MTGFGHGCADFGRVTAEVSIRTVNHRSLDLRWAGSEMAPTLESDATEMVRHSMARGRVEARVTIRVRPTADEEAWSGVDELVERMKAARQRYALREDPSLADLAAAGAFTMRGSGHADPSELREAVIGALGAALDELTETRRREGRALKADFDARAAAYAAFLDDVEMRVPALRDALGEKLRSRVAQALGSLGDASTQVPQERIFAELAMLVERADIAEELTRAREHTRALVAVLAQGGAIGRRIELLLQELVRETNTMAAKSPDALLTQRILDARLLVEQMKEQAANVE
jgi:uncharacterized protein (TIGR00255 family)